MTSILIKLVAVAPMLAFGAAILSTSPAAAHWPQHDWRWRHYHHHHHHQWQPPYHHRGHYNPPPRPYYPPHHRGW